MSDQKIQELNEALKELMPQYYEDGLRICLCSCQCGGRYAYVFNNTMIGCTCHHTLILGLHTYLSMDTFEMESTPYLSQIDE